MQFYMPLRPDMVMAMACLVIDHAFPTVISNSIRAISHINFRQVTTVELTLGIYGFWKIWKINGKSILLPDCVDILH